MLLHVLIPEKRLFSEISNCSYSKTGTGRSHHQGTDLVGSVIQDNNNN